MDRSGLTLGILAGLLGIACCVSPVVLVVLGLSTVSFAISLGNTLYYEYGWYFRGAALLLAIVGIVGRHSGAANRAASPAHGISGGYC